MYPPYEPTDAEMDEWDYIDDDDQPTSAMWVDDDDCMDTVDLTPDEILKIKEHQP